MEMEGEDKHVMPECYAVKKIKKNKKNPWSCK